MTSVPLESRQWPASRWWIAIAGVFAVQVVLMVWLEDRSAPIARPPGLMPAFRFSESPLGEFLAIEDPTLCALPHPQGFSGDAWLKGSSPVFTLGDWTEPARCLALDPGELGTRFRHFMATNTPAPFSALATLDPEIAVAQDFSIAPAPTSSGLRIEGDLAGRRLLSGLRLPIWTNSDLLAGSLVQLAVDARGYPVSAVLLPPGSGLKEADRCALELARTARFEPLDEPAAQSGNPPPGLSIGTLWFEWQTVPAPFTNSPAVP
jgi:hypothetical protein